MLINTVEPPTRSTASVTSDPVSNARAASSIIASTGIASASFNVKASEHAVRPAVRLEAEALMTRLFDPASRSGTKKAVSPTTNT